MTYIFVAAKSTLSPQARKSVRRAGVLAFALSLFSTVNACGPKSDGAASPEAETTPMGLQVEVTAHGDGPVPTPGNVVIAHYTGKLTNGEVFDSSRDRGTPFAFTLDAKEVIKGWDEGFAQLRVGDQAILTIPPELAYGEQGRPGIPPNSTLIFDVEFVGLAESSLANELKSELDKNGIEGGQKLIDQLTADGFGDLYVSEGQLNGLGYRYLQNNEIDRAVAVFEWTVALFPDSWNAYDSLAESYAADDQLDLAVSNYEKSLELNPENDNAAQMLKKLAEAME